MLFAVVDIETTGGHAASNGITEIAVVVTDGRQIISKFHTLLNPVYTIPSFIASLTGITNEMVEFEQDFKSIANELYEILQDKIFVAHNVNFDFSFIKYNLAQCGLDLKVKKLCTIRFGRRVLPSLKGYGLDKICNHLNIKIEGRHRAYGDALATVALLHYLLQNDTNGYVQTMLKASSKEQFLPPNLSSIVVEKLPEGPGVYYFHDKKEKVIYVGKAKNLRKRVTSHFSNNKPSPQKQQFLKSIYNITYCKTPTELMAFILENIEIRRLWPQQNRSQKRFEPTYGLYCFEDGGGYLRLCMEKNKKHLKPLYTFNLMAEGVALLRKLVNEYDLCPKLCFMQRDNSKCLALKENKCAGACEKQEATESYNKRVRECIEQFEMNLPSFALVDEGLSNNEQSCILIERGKFYGMGYLPSDLQVNDAEGLKNYLTPHVESDYIRSMIYQYAERFPDKKVSLRNQFFQ